jgi:hypothetical protein
MLQHLVRPEFERLLNRNKPDSPLSTHRNLWSDYQGRVMGATNRTNYQRNLGTQPALPQDRPKVNAQKTRADLGFVQNGQV